MAPTRHAMMTAVRKGSKKRVIRLNTEKKKKIFGNIHISNSQTVNIKKYFGLLFRFGSHKTLLIYTSLFKTENVLR